MEFFIVIALVLVGIVLLLAEFIFVPGTTVVGLLGALLSIIGVFFAYGYFGSLVGTATLGGTLIIGTVGGYYGLSSGTWNRFALHDTLDDKSQHRIVDLTIGQQGSTLSALRPFGTAEFDGETYEVRTKGSFLNSGRTVQIIKIEGRKVFVEEVVS